MELSVEFIYYSNNQNMTLGKFTVVEGIDLNFYGD